MKIAIVCEPQTQAAFENRKAMDNKSMRLIESFLPREAQLKWVFLCPPVPAEFKNSEGRIWEHVKTAYGKDTIARVAQSCEGADLVISLGKHALRVVAGDGQSVTKARGVLQTLQSGLRLLPTLAPSQSHYNPGTMAVLKNDMELAAKLIANGFDHSAISSVGDECRWCFDLTDWRGPKKPKFICLDTETWGPDGKALRVCEPGLKIMTIQVAASEDEARVIPSPMYFAQHRAWFSEHFPDVTDEQCAKAYRQALAVCADREIKKTGHNLAYDFQALATAEGVQLRGWVHETMMLSHYLDQDTYFRNLDALVMQYVPRFAGYADLFNSETDKSDMLSVPPEKMLPYAGGDAVAGFGLCKVLAKEVHKDQPNWRVYRHISMPGTIAFARMKARGMKVNTEVLKTVRVEMLKRQAELYAELIAETPKAALDEAVRLIRDRKQAKLKKKVLGPDWMPDLDETWKFSRAEFAKLVLFSPFGFDLTPSVYTKSTTDLKPQVIHKMEISEDGEEEEFDEIVDPRVASVSTKEHLPYHAAKDNPDTGFKASRSQKYVTKLIEYLKIGKLLSTYVGNYEEGTGLWQHITEKGFVHSTFTLWSTNTGRSNSRAPNAQNYPVKNDFAKPFLKCFDAPEGYVFICADLSQIELRIAATESGDPTMLKIYRDGLDIHEITGQVVAGLDDLAWKTLDASIRKRKRGDAKPVNFGFLYGMWWRKFKVYAFTSYGVTFTDQEAEAIRTRFFVKYARLPIWHQRKIKEVNETGGVRALHGRRRSLPAIYSHDESKRKAVERQAINSTVQGFGSDLGVAALARLEAQIEVAQIDWFKPVGFVHDAAYAYVRKDKVKEGVETLVWAMETVPLEEWFGLKMPIPIVSEPDVGLSWGDKVELAEMKKPAEFDKLKPEHWFRQWDADYDLRGYAPQKPTWWRDDLEMMGAEAFDA